MAIPRRWTALSALLATIALGGGVAASAAATAQAPQVGDQAQSACQLAQTSGRGIKHVVVVEWDNTHLLRDNPNVASDLEQMPHLLNFLRGDGTLLSNEHTPLIAHTADDLVTSETGLYPDHQGLSVANNYGYFNADGSISFPSAFSYWTDPVQTSATPSPTYNLVGQNGKNVPAPWVPFTRVGCNVGVVAAADMELESTDTSPTGDITRVFGTGSPLYAQAVKDNGSSAPQGLGEANFEGLTVHCARGSSLCASGQPDALPDEPGGYNGFKGLFGALQVDPALTGQSDTTSGGYERAPALTALDGTAIKDSGGNPGFPGYDGLTPNVALGITAAMQEHGAPVTYTYLTDAHDNQTTGNSSGPGAPDYEARLHAYDQAFGRFFARLARHGINRSNTLFMFTADEGDHFVGAKPTNPSCDGVTVPCNYEPSKVGEINADLAPLLKAQTGDTTPFQVENDSAPAFYLNGNPGPTSPATRQLERDTADLSVWNPITARNVPLTNYLAGPTELNLLHMETADPRRNPSFVMFANPNYYLDATSSSCPAGAVQPGCVSQQQGDAYSHGDIAPEINRTWLGMVGPGVKHRGETAAVWSDHTDDRPTMLKLLGLHDDYTSQGRVLTEMLDNSVTSASLRSDATLEMQRVYTQLQAPVGEFGMETLQASTGALAAGDPGDAIYTQCSSQLQRLGDERDKVAAVMQSLLTGAEFHGQAIGPAVAHGLTLQGEQILKQALAAKEYCS